MDPRPEPRRSRNLRFYEIPLAALALRADIVNVSRNFSNSFIQSLAFAAAISFAVIGCTRTAYIVQDPPPPQEESKSPSPGPKHTWVDGHWKWSGNRYIWVSGHWEKQRGNKTFVAGHWDRTAHGWRWVPGHWRR